MPQKKKLEKIGFVQACRVSLCRGIVAGQCSSAVHKNPTTGREDRELRPHGLSVVPDERALNPLSSGEPMSTRSDATRLPASERTITTTITVQHGDGPARILRFPHAVELVFRRPLHGSDAA